MSNSLRMVKGTSRRLRVTVQDLTDPDNPTNVPVVAADRVRCTVKSNTLDSVTPIIEKDSDNPGDVILNVGGDNWVLDIVLVPVDTSTVTEGEYMYDVKIDFDATSESANVVLDTIELISPATTVLV